MGRQRIIPLFCAIVALFCLQAGCAPEALDCSMERCQIWTCGEAMPTCPCSDLCERPACVELTVHARDPEGGPCQELSSPCDVPDGWDYFLDAEQCEGGGSVCHTSEDCNEGEVCDIRSCADAAVGSCEAIPEACPELLEPVYGCDGTEYSNDCQRLSAGAALSPEVVSSGCRDTGVWAQDPASGVCSFFGSSCHVPDDWPHFLSRAECEGDGCGSGPVWTFDAEAGECVELPGSCAVIEGAEFFLSLEACEGTPSRCGPDAVCPDGLFCEPDSCAGGAGQCVPFPADCVETQETVPTQVCGCDGVTYPNDCERLLAGVGYAHDGSCEG